MSTTADVAVKREQEPTVAHHDSQEEYESAEEIEGEYDEDEVEEIEIEEEVEEEEEEELDEEEDEDEEDEDGLTKQKDKPLDDDEDRKNPQFIPKKGYFYEHDDRTRIEDEPVDEPEEPPKKEEKPKPTKDGMDKWSHDKFDESEQAPKSQEELQTVYGYDIRSEDQPPRARRRRRYGRGPTKYTRRWEEEEAYQKPRGGFRGGRGKGRGFQRGSTRDNRGDSRDEYDEDFPELGDSVKSNLSVNKVGKSEQVPPIKQVAPSVSVPPVKRDIIEQEQPNIKRDAPRVSESMDRGRDRDNYGSPRGGGPPRDGRQMGGREWEYERGGGRGRGGVSNRRGGRRNEFTNRNRYPNRRDPRDDGDYNDYSSNSNSNNVTKSSGGSNNNRTSYNNSYESRERDYTGFKSKMDNNRRGEQKESRTIVNGTSNDSKQKPYVNDAKPDKPPHQQSQHQPQQHRIPPFTNTEYPAPGKGSNTPNIRIGNNSGPNSNRPHNDRQNNFHAEPMEERHREREPIQHVPHVEQRTEIKDLRDKINAIRMQKGYQNPNDRRAQIPPRLQQQQQPPPQQAMDNSAKPRRYSTQRERPVHQQTIVTTGGMVIPNTVAPSMAQGVPSLVSVVNMGDGVISTPVPVAAYPPSNYYEGTQVYEASGSPVTGNNGPSVSPSLWTAHAPAFAAAPYPSPPTAPQVPQVPQPPYGDPTAFIGPGGPAIYAAPPQFIPDPSLINYSNHGPAPPFPPPYHAHPQGFQGYAQVTPAPLPEVYHGGVTYYSTQNQMQRPPMMAPQKRPKSVLQLVEPPEKSKVDKGPKEHHHAEHPPPELAMNSIPETPSEAELTKQMEEVSLHPRENLERKPSPLREFNEETSWAAEMEMSSPTSCYPEEPHFDTPPDDGKQSVVETQNSKAVTNNESSKTTNAKKPEGTKESNEKLASTD